MIFRAVRFRYPGASTDSLGPVDLAGPSDRPWLVLGPTGSGKTTLLRLLAGQLAPTSGQMESVPSGAAYLPQFPERVLAGRNLAEDLIGQVRPEREIRARLRSALAHVGLEGKPLSLKNQDLSGGERRQVALALLVLAERAHWALDEPDAGLDRCGCRRLVNLLREQTLAAGAGLWIASHRFDLYGALDPWVLVLEGGLPVAAGDLRHVLGLQEVHRVLGLSAWAPAALWARYAGTGTEDLFAAVRGDGSCHEAVRTGLLQRAGFGAIAKGVASPNVKET